MARKVAQSDIDGWVEFRNKGYTYERVGKETGWDPETVRRYIGGEQKPREKEEEEPEGGERGSELGIQAKAFKEFEAGKNWRDLVKSEICTISMAKELQKSWNEGEVGGEDMGDKLSELREGIFEESRYVSGGAVSFSQKYRRMVSTEEYATRGGKSQLGKTYCFGCYKAIVFTRPDTTITDVIKSLKLITNYLVERLKKKESEEGK